MNFCKGAREEARVTTVMSISPAGVKMKRKKKQLPLRYHSCLSGNSMGLFFSAVPNVATGGKTAMTSRRRRTWLSKGLFRSLQFPVHSKISGVQSVQVFFPEADCIFFFIIKYSTNFSIKLLSDSLKDSQSKCSLSRSVSGTLHNKMMSLCV